MSESNLNIPDFEVYLDYDKYIPHYLKLEKNDLDTKNFINATLNCLTNISSFLEYIYKFNEISSSSKYFKILYNEIKQIYSNIGNKNKKYNPEQFTKLIFYLFEKQSIQHEPRTLIDYIFNFFLNINKNEMQESIAGKKDGKTDCNYLKIDDSSYNELDCNFIETKKIDIKKLKEDKLEIIIEKVQTCQNEKCREISKFYKHFPILHFYLNPNSEKEYTLGDCFNEFFKKENEESEYICSKCSKINKCESKSSFCQIPKSLIIFIYYENKNNEELKEFYYKFEKEIDFSNSNYISDDIKSKKYFLSSIIECKSPKKNNEHFYTFCRKENNSKFLIYNTNEKDVRDHGKNVDRQTARLKNEPPEKRGYPYVLVYTEL